MKYSRLLAAVAAVSGLAACTSGNGAVAPPVASVNVASPAYSKLQFAVGTANIAGQLMLNTVVTLRQPNGDSAVGYTTPAITWDGAFTNPAPKPSNNVDKGKPQITGSLPANPVGTSVPPATFGSGANSIGAFGYGFNNRNSGTNNTTSISYPCLPAFAAQFLTAPNLTAVTDPVCPTSSVLSGPVQFVGGPPLFPDLRTAPLAGAEGEFLGFTPFAGIVPKPNPATGTSVFTLNVTIPTQGGVTTLPPVTSTMVNFAGLPTFATPVAVESGGGGFTSVSYVTPPGATEGMIMVIDLGPDPANGSPNCHFNGGPPFYPFYYTARIGPGAGTVSFGDNLAPKPAVGTLPAGFSTHTICTAADNAAAAAVSIPITNNGTPVGNGTPAVADQYVVLGLAFDYPAIEAAYPFSNGNQAPVITGNNGQADVSISDSTPQATY